MKLSIGADTLLVIVFGVLKLTDLINWSWWWVFSPYWISLSVVALVGMIHAVGHFLDRK